MEDRQVSLKQVLDALHGYFDGMLETDTWSQCDVYGLIEMLPSAHPEIIRCKECKHRDAEKGFCEGRGWPMQLVPDDGFCDKGEMSEE